jgi:hypothetical protein
MSARVPGLRLQDSSRKLTKFGAYISVSPAPRALQGDGRGQFDDVEAGLTKEGHPGFEPGSALEIDSAQA